MFIHLYLQAFFIPPISFKISQKL